MRIAVWAIVIGGCVSPADPPAEPVPVPFVVSDYYSPDGFWGDGETFGFIDVQRVCPDRPPGARGDCYTITYKAGPKRNGGIFWQYPHNNWGFEPGRRISDGATKIVFQVKGKAGGEMVGFSAGQPGKLAHFDGFSLSTQRATLTTAWAPQTMLLRGERYSGMSGLLGAFEVIFEAPADDATTVFYLADVQWQ